MNIRRIFAALLMAVTVIAGLLTLACAAPPPLPTYTPYPTQSPLPTLTPFPTWTPAPTASAYPSPTPYPTATAYPAPTALPTLTPYPIWTPYPTATPPGREDTRLPTHTPHSQPTPYLRPTDTPPPTTGPGVPIVHGRVGDWILGSIDYSATLGYNTRSVINDQDKMQQYTCVEKMNGETVARANLKFPYELNHQMVTNEFGEAQGEVKSVTIIAGEVVPVEWLTWVSRTDRIRARGESAILLVSEIAARQATSFWLELPGNPELSATYSVEDFIEALDANQMTCFQ